MHWAIIRWHSGRIYTMQLVSKIKMLTKIRPIRSRINWSPCIRFATTLISRADSCRASIYWALVLVPARTRDNCIFKMGLAHAVPFSMQMETRETDTKFTRTLLNSKQEKHTRSTRRWMAWVVFGISHCSQCSVWKSKLVHTRYTLYIYVYI